MSFVSWIFPLFLVTVFATFWLLRGRARIYVLLVSSYIFYGAWDARFLALIFISTAVDYCCGLAIGGRKLTTIKVVLLGFVPAVWLVACRVLHLTRVDIENWLFFVVALFPIVFTAIYLSMWSLRKAHQPRGFLILNLSINFGLLGFFKYLNFFFDSAAGVLASIGLHPNWTLGHIILPVGISFYTFQSASYTVEVYRGRLKPTDDLIAFAAYLTFFPQLVAGPIERSYNLLPQLQRTAMFKVSNIHEGLRLILFGLFKKMFVGDNCALLANYAFDPKTPLNGPWAVLGVLAFAAQIYGDFSGYTDIARGTAKLFDVHLSRNFNFPYFARGPWDFWQRWHVTLSSWFRDYVFLPLAYSFSRKMPKEEYLGLKSDKVIYLLATSITFLLCGFWHGANWTFVVWGGFHGALLILYRFIPFLKRLEKSERGLAWRAPLSTAVMFALTLVGWAIFRSRDMHALGSWFLALGSWQTVGAVDWVKPLCWMLIHVSPLLLLQVFTWKSRDEVEVAHCPWPVRGFAYACLLFLLLTSAAYDVEFIYFQF